MLQNSIVMKLSFYGLNSVAVVITFFSGLSVVPVGLVSFALSPYIVAFYLVKIAKHQTARVTAMVITVFIVSVGLYFLLDTTYMERRLEYKFSFLFIPIWQWTMLMVSGSVIYLSNKPSDQHKEEK